MPCNCSADLPSVAAQVANAAKAAGKVFGAVVMGRPVKVSEEVFQSRLNVCKACSSVVAIREEHRCSQCGCWLNGKTFAKASLATEICPLNKWEALP